MVNLGKYEILNEIGKGGFGTVYRAKDTVLDREVALKVLKPAWLDDSRAVTMFYREARAAAKLAHPCIVTIFDMGEAEGRLFIAMELIDGEPLNARIKRVGGQPLADVLPVIADVASALEVAHKAGITHRDIKPSNILLRKDGRAVLTDFGLVRGGELATMATTSSAGSAMGTPEYIAPEIWEGQGASAPSDVYALACVVYEMLTGDVLFAGNSTPAVMRKHFSAPDLSRVAGSKVARLLQTALAADAVKRPGAGELVDRLQLVNGDEDDADGARGVEIAEVGASRVTAHTDSRWTDAREEAGNGESVSPSDPAAVDRLSQPNRQNGATEEGKARIREARRNLDEAIASQRWSDAERFAKAILALVPDDEHAKANLVLIGTGRMASQRAVVESRSSVEVERPSAKMVAAQPEKRLAASHERTTTSLAPGPDDPSSTGAQVSAKSADVSDAIGGPSELPKGSIEDAANAVSRERTAQSSSKRVFPVRIAMVLVALVLCSASLLVLLTPPAPSPAPSPVQATATNTLIPTITVVPQTPTRSDTPIPPTTTPTALVPTLALPSTPTDVPVPTAVSIPATSTPIPAATRIPPSQTPIPPVVPATNATIADPSFSESFPCSLTTLAKLSILCVEQPYPIPKGSTIFLAWNIQTTFARGAIDVGDGRGFADAIGRQSRKQVENLVARRLIRLSWEDESGNKYIDQMSVHVFEVRQPVDPPPANTPASGSGLVKIDEDKATSKGILLVFGLSSLIGAMVYSRRSRPIDRHESHHTE